MLVKVRSWEFKVQEQVQVVKFQKAPSFALLLIFEFIREILQSLRSFRITGWNKGVILRGLQSIYFG